MSEAKPRKSLLPPFAHLDGEWSLQPANDEALVLPRVGHSAVAVGEWILLVGGVQPTQASREREVSCIHRTGKWWHRLQCAGNAPTGRSWHTATVVSGGRVLVFGGSNGRKLFDDLHQLQLTLGEADEPPVGARWSHPTTTGDKPRSRMGHTAACMPGDRLWSFGGFTKASASKGYALELYELDVSSMEWRLLQPEQADSEEPPIVGRLGASSFVHAETFLVFGGSINGKAVNELLALSSTRLAASAASPTSRASPSSAADAAATIARVQAAGRAAVTPRHSAAATRSPCGRYAFIHGGCECDKELGLNRTLGDLLQLNLQTYTWAVLTPAKGSIVPGLRFKHSFLAVDDHARTSTLARTSPSPAPPPSPSPSPGPRPSP